MSDIKTESWNGTTFYIVNGRRYATYGLAYRAAIGKDN